MSLFAILRATSVNDIVVLVQETTLVPVPPTWHDFYIVKRVALFGFTISVVTVLLFVGKRRWRQSRRQAKEMEELRRTIREDTKAARKTKRAKCYQAEVGTCDDSKRVNRDEGTKAGAIEVEYDDKSVASLLLRGDSTSDTDYTFPANKFVDEQQVNTIVHLDALLPPTLVEEKDTCIPAVNKTTSISVVSDSLELAIPNDDNSNNNTIYSFASLPLLLSKQTKQNVVKEAQNVAQSIRVTQAVFEQHGLDAGIATEWAMRRQESELSVCETE